MVAAALGDVCKVVGRGWHPWDLQLGDDENEFPKRIRIQVKNTARLQSWYPLTGKPSNCQWTLPIKKRPTYFDEYHTNTPCEDYGHLCDLYVLCHHPVEDIKIADHRDVNQWDFYLVPVVGSKTMYEAYAKPEGQKNSPSYTVVPSSLKKGTRGRSAVEPISFDELNEQAIREAMGI